VEVQVKEVAVVDRFVEIHSKHLIIYSYMMGLGFKFDIGERILNLQTQT